MAYQEVNRGTSDNDSTGDNLRDAGLKINQNFTELYTYFGDGTQLSYAPNLDDLTNVSASSPTIGDVLYYDGSNWVVNSGPLLQYSFSANGTSAYLIEGAGVDSSTDNPNLYFYRGHTYILMNTTGSSHPLNISYSDNTSLSAYISGSQTARQIITVPMNPYSVNLKYECTIHTANMNGTITII
jgi:hypothetical protein